jgi:wyosine [tRNA(Phe)-imidazoG37] synthetase (radical SAM superfamily)
LKRAIPHEKIELETTTLPDSMPIAFGPAPSRRLEKSLGINNIRQKTYSYSCVYCQLGKTSENTVERQVFYQPFHILRDVARKVDDTSVRNERIDCLTFVSDEEPTLDINIIKEISVLDQVGIPIAVITA